MNNLGKTLPPLSSLLPFEAAARLESFSRAAEELHLTQAAISRQIRALEDDLGITLFERRNRGVFLTSEGHEFGRTVSYALEGIANQAKTLRGETRDSQVILFCQLCEAFYWLMPRMASFNQRHPDIDIKLATSTRPITEFNDSFDIALQTTGRPSGSHMLAFTAPDEVFPICSTHYLPMADTRLSLAELPRHALLHHKAEPADWLEWDGWLRTMGHFQTEPLAGMTFDSYPVMLQATLAGHGIALGWRLTSQRLLASGELIRPVKESLPLSDAISVYTRQGATKRSECLALLNWLQEELGAP